VTVGCSDTGGWDDGRAVTASGSVGGTDGWYAVDITALAQAVESYRSNWFVHISGGTPEVRLNGTGKSTRPYIEVEWEYAAATITGDKSSVPLGEAVTFTITPEVSGETHTLSYALGSVGGTIAEGAGNSVAWTPPESLAAEMPDSDAASIRIAMAAYDSSGALLRREIYYQTVTVPSSMRPTVSATGAALSGGLSGYGLRGRTKISLRPVVDMNSAYGAQLVSVTAAVTGGQSVKWTEFSESTGEYAGRFTCDSVLTGAITAAGEVRVDVTATDSRGRSMTLYRTFTFCDYSLPVITDFSVTRMEPSYDENEQIAGYAPGDMGDRLAVTLTAEAAQVMPGSAQLNRLSYSITGVNDETGETVSGAAVSGATDASGRRIQLSLNMDVFPGTFGGDESWTFTATVTDTAGGSAAGYSAVAEAHAAFSISPDKRGFAVGMIATGEKQNPRFEVAEDYDALFYGGVRGADGWRLDRPFSMELLSDGSNANFAAYNASLTPRISRVGPLVFMDGFVRNVAALAAGFDEVLLTLPEVFRPAVDVSLLQQGSNGAVWWLRINANGDVHICRYRSSWSGYDAIESGVYRQFPLSACWIAADAY